jgi:hypothetical protein
MTCVWPDKGGGWMNGRGDDTMTMPQGYAHLVDFFTSFEWWKTEPHDELVDHGDCCLAKPGETYAVYLPKGGKVAIHLLSHRYEAAWFNAITGEWTDLAPIEDSSWTSPKAPSANDWVLLIRRV